MDGKIANVLLSLTLLGVQVTARSHQTESEGRATTGDRQRPSPPFTSKIGRTIDHGRTMVGQVENCAMDARSKLLLLVWLKQRERRRRYWVHPINASNILRGRYAETRGGGILRTINPLYSPFFQHTHAHTRARARVVPCCCSPVLQI